MMKKMRRILTAGAAVGALVLVSACSGGETGEQSTTSASDDTSVAEGSCETVLFWQNQFSTEDNAWFEEAVDSYNASQSKVHVELTVVPGDTWDQKLKAAQAAGTAPDMYTMNYSAVPMNARHGQLAPITEYISGEAWKDLDERFFNAVSVDGESYAYPLYYEPSALFMYRTDIFEQSGLDPASPPTTYDELIETGLALKDANPNVVPFQIAQTANELAWSTWGAQKGTAGHLPISDDWSEALADDPAYEPLFNLFQQLYGQGILAKQPLSAYGDATPLGEGKLASMANGAWGISLLLNDYPDEVQNIAIAPMPTFDGDSSRTTSTLGGWNIGVDAKSECIAEAAEAIDYMLAADTSVPKDYFVKTKFTKLSPRISVSEEIAADPARLENPYYDVLVESTKTAILEPMYDWQVSMAFGTALEKAMRGEEIASVQAEAQEEITRLIAELDLGNQPH